MGSGIPLLSYLRGNYPLGRAGIYNLEDKSLFLNQLLLAFFISYACFSAQKVLPRDWNVFIQQAFGWNDREDKRRYHIVGSDTVCYHIMESGLHGCQFHSIPIPASSELIVLKLAWVEWKHSAPPSKKNNNNNTL